MLERRVLPGGPVALVSTAMEEAGFLAAFTERTGGVSEGSFRSLNLGLATADQPEHVIENRRRLAAAFGLEQLAATRQVHGSRVVTVGAGMAWLGYAGRRRLPAGDGLATSGTGLGLVILTADCVPVAMADPQAGLLAVVHAGWRGVAAGVIGEAIRMFPDTSAVLTAVGPSVGPDHYEVGEDVAAAVGAASRRGAVTRGNGPRPMLDLPGTIERILGDLGVKRVERAEECTACQSDRFFSHRRDGTTGRQALVAARRP